MKTRSLRKGTLRIECLVVPPLENNVYILYEDGSDDCTVIDVAMGSEEIAKRVRDLDLRISTIVNTHGHADHMAEDDKLKKDFSGAKLAIHELDSYRLALGEDEATLTLGLIIKPIEADVQLMEGDKIPVGKNLGLHVMHTPGHTEGSICLHDSERLLLFSGDTLFARGYGRTDGRGGDMEQLHVSLKRLSRLPLQTEVYPGHGPFTTIGEELPWLKEMLGEETQATPIDRSSS